MKNSQENLSLPTQPVTLIIKDKDTCVEKTIVLPDYLKKESMGLILYFYPKDNTAGCTAQATEFSEHNKALIELGYQTLGVSRDGIKSHQNFINKHNLTIGLITDTEEVLCQHFDVIKEKMMYGKTHLGVVRSTFVFNQNGQMIASFRNVKAKEHQAKLLEYLRQIQ